MAGRARHLTILAAAALGLGTAAAVVSSGSVQGPEIEERTVWVRNDEGNVQAYRITIHNATGRTTRVRCTVEVVSAAENPRVLAHDTFHTDPIAPGDRVTRESEFEEVPRRPGPFEIQAAPVTGCAAIGR